MVHPRVIEIDIKHYSDTVTEAKTRATDAKIMAVVKANAYGLGASKMATEALRAGADFLGVATPQEALDLLGFGIQAPILLLSEILDTVPVQLLHQNVRFTVYSPAFIRILGQLSNETGLDTFVHLKLNTGMNRLGANPGEIVSLLSLIDTFPRLKLEGLMTHFACADTPDHPANAHQLNRFHSALRWLSQNEKKIPLVHAANSDAFHRMAQTSFDMVRLGLSTYRDCVTLKTVLGFLQQVPPGEGVSYGWHFTLQNPSWIATLPFGYADGIPSRYGLQGGQVLIKNKRYPIVGKVCMDMMMVYLGTNPEHLQIGEEVILFGGKKEHAISLLESANWANRNEYEMLCALGPRVERKYIKK